MDVFWNSLKNFFSLSLDIAENRLQVAKEIGADYTVLVKTDEAEILAQQIQKVLGGMPDITIECSGAESSIRLGIFVSMLLLLIRMKRVSSLLLLTDLLWFIIHLFTVYQFVFGAFCLHNVRWIGLWIYYCKEVKLIPCNTLSYSSSTW